MSLEAYRASASEQARIASLVALMPESFSTGLDIGARDGYISLRMAERGDRITALDLTMPGVAHDKITCVQGNAAALDFASNAFDLVVCAEVLEHIPSPALELACAEIARVTRKWAVIGVPLSQDTRFGATRCPSCGKTNPPWGHVNSFSVEHLQALFATLAARQVQFVGTTRNRTNALSHALMAYAGHPFGTYSQDETCVYCDSPITYSGERSFIQRLATRAAHVLTNGQQRFARPRPMWVNILFEKI